MTLLRLLVLLTIVCGSFWAAADEVYQTPADFVAKAFNGDPPAPQRLWLRKPERAALRAILERDFGQLRVRYWQRDTRTVWILEEIGKEQPITTGLVVEGQALADVRVLVFRSLRLTDTHELSGKIDGISGATLSVRALTKLARVALLLDRYAQKPTP